MDKLPTNRLLAHILRYGACWIVGLALYIFVLWFLPVQLTGTRWSIMWLHMLIIVGLWFLHGVGALRPRK
jgi:hypothetical protein